MGKRDVIKVGNTEIETPVEFVNVTDDMPLWVKVVAWIESCIIWEGMHKGKNVKLQPFQIEFIKRFLENDLIVMSFARGNGKTTLLALLIACHVTGPLAVNNTVIPIIASTKKQAAIAVHHTWEFLRPDWEIEPSRFKLNESDDDAEIIDTVNNIIVRAMSAAPQSKHGLAPVLACGDECAQWSVNGGEKVFNSLVGGRGKHEKSRVVLVSTMPDSDEHFFSKAMKVGLDPELRKGTGTYGMLWQSSIDADFDDINEVQKANPMWKHIPSLRQTIKNEIASVKAGSISKPHFEAYRMNKGVPETDLVEYILHPNPKQQWLTCETHEPPERNGPAFIGLDPGESKSLTAAAIYYPCAHVDGDIVRGRLEIFAGLPAHPPLEERSVKDGSPGLYEKAAEMGELNVFSGRVTPIDQFIKWLREQLEGEDDIREVISDSYKQENVLQAMVSAGNGWHNIAEFRRVGRGAHGYEDITAFQREIFDGILKCRPSILMRSAIRDARIVRDSNGNPALDKSRNRGRIDCLQAAVLAVGAGRRYRNPSEDKSADISDFIAI